MATSKRQKKPLPRGKASSAADLKSNHHYAASLFPVICIGASAGGLEPITEVIGNVSPDAGMAFIIVQHHDPKVATALPQILARSTKMPVKVAEEGEALRANVVYVAPSDAEVTVEQGIVHVGGHADRVRMPIDNVFRSLAEDLGSRAIGVILSGAASDGTLGAKAIKAEGGIVFAQDDSARFDSMPRSAIAAGAADFVLSPKDIAHELQRIARHSYVSGLAAAGGRLKESDLAQVFSLLRAAHDTDFTHYKPATVERRIRRRMAVRKTETLAEYLEVLREKNDEVEQLYGDILIRVTGFFRDPAVFETLERDVLPAIVREHKSDSVPVRIWVPGCATGEEVYSIAIAFFETFGGFSCPIQIFGTDVSEGAIGRARGGLYPENIVADISPERLKRFFTRVDGGYRVSKPVRDCCIFARQDLTRDPPFSRLDLISCRNVLIYLGAVLQRRVMGIFHYALRPDGYLLLGSSEAIGNFAELFAVADRRHKIYVKKNAAQRPAMDFAVPPPAVERRAEHHVAADDPPNPANVFREADRILLTRYSPAGVLVNDNMEILQFRGRTSAFLEPAPGAASLNLLKMAREGILSELRTAVFSARKTEAPVRREGLRVRSNGSTITANVDVIPFVGMGNDRYFLVLFQEVPAAPGNSKKVTKKDATERQDLVRLKRELEATREYLQSIIEEQEAMNEELRSANEEIQSSNEELQSTNEELETAKEELQSTNEELTTLNEELENSNQELAQVNNDLLNLLASVDFPIIMLDSALRIHRFNPAAQRALNLVPGDTGRPISDLNLPLEIDHIEEMIASVVENLETRELKVRDRNGRLQLMRMRPYKTTENRIEGAVLVMVDIDEAAL